MEMFLRAPNEELIPRAREAALKALSLDSNSAGGHSCIGFIQLYFDWDWEAARNNLFRALELSPNDAPTRHAYADYLMVMGDLEESLNQVEIGLLYDPFSPMASSVVTFHRLLARQYDEVIEEGRDAIAREPDSIVNRANYQEALWLKGMNEEAFAAYKRTWGRDKELLQAMEKGYTQSGYNGAIYSLAEALAARVPEFDDYITLARFYARAGEPDSALAWLEEAYQQRQPQILHIKAMPVFDGLHSSPEFQDLLNRIGFPASAPRSSH
jgi:tetratricopeptide (TPR) repeat protein